MFKHKSFARFSFIGSAIMNLLNFIICIGLIFFYYLSRKVLCGSDSFNAILFPYKCLAIIYLNKKEKYLGLTAFPKENSGTISRRVESLLKWVPEDFTKHGEFFWFI